MDIVFEALLVILRLLAEALFQFVGEVILQLAFEALVELGLHWGRKPLHLPRLSPWLAVIGHALAGAAAGALSLWLFPSLFIAHRWASIANILATPLVAGALMAQLGAWRRRRGEELLRLDHFAYGFIFALAMSVVRFVFAK